MQTNLNSSAKRELQRIIGREQISDNEINAAFEELTASESVRWQLEESVAVAYDHNGPTGHHIQFN